MSEAEDHERDESDTPAPAELPQSELSLDDSLWDESSATSDADAARDTLTPSRRRMMRRAHHG